METNVGMLILNFSVYIIFTIYRVNYSIEGDNNE